jgi:hypothetical protein
MPNKKSESEISIRSVIIFLKSPLGGALSASKIQALLDPQIAISISQINTIYKNAIERGFNPNASKFLIKDEFVTNLQRTGRPSKQTKEVIQLVQDAIERDCFGREKSCADITEGLLEITRINISE